MTGALFVVLWAGLNFVLWVLYWAVFDADARGVGITAAAIGIVTFAGLVAAWRIRRERTPSDRVALATPDTSHAAALFGIAVGLGALSTEFGPWLAYGAALTAVFATGGLMREWRAQRADERELRRRYPEGTERIAR
jgi:peptidoglycan/LPS O-acetylase OafA/YrhL